LVRKRHGGHLNRNSYEPNWQYFHENEAAWKERMRTGARFVGETKMSPQPCQASHVHGDIPVAQTCLNNQSKETFRKTLPKKNEGEVVGQPHPQTSIKARSKNNAARVSAERRWTDDLHENFAKSPVTYGEIINAIDTAMKEAATDAEMERPGGGIAHIMHAL